MYYFENFNIDTDRSEDYYEVQNLNELSKRLSGLTSDMFMPGYTTWKVTPKARQLFEVTRQLDKISYITTPEVLFRNKSSESGVISSFCDDSYTFYRQLSEDNFSRPATKGILICLHFKTRFEEIPNTKRLPAVERELKQTSTHFIRVMTRNQLLMVYTNKPLRVADICKLKIIQYTLFGESYPYKCNEILDFYKALINKDNNKADILINKICNLDILRTIKYQAIRDAFKINSDGKIRELENNVNRKNADILSYENKIVKIISEIQTLNEEIELLINKKDDSEEEINKVLKYLSKHPYIKDVNKGGTSNTVNFYYEAPILYYNEDIAKRTSRAQTHIDKMIVRGIISDRFELYTRCSIIFNTQTFEVSTPRIGATAKLLGHPHIDTHGCFGNHRRAIKESAVSGDYFGAIEEISQAVLNLNFTDGCVIRRLLKDLNQFRNSLPTWLDKTTNQFVTTNTVIEVMEAEYEKA